MSGGGPSRPVDRATLEAILDEQRASWDSGGGTPVEELLARHPGLCDDAEAAIDLIYQEYVLRRRLGGLPRPEEYLHRFPAWSDALIYQFAADEALRSRGSPPEEPTTMALAGPVPPGEASPMRIEGYDFLGELGRGGMGVVYKALDRRLNRVVAIKTISETALASPSQVRRFLAEAQAIARVRHPHIIPIHAIGEEQGRPYFSLEFAEGGSLAHRLREGPLTIGEAARLVEVLARAVHSAHRAGIIHRDLKPSNVLLAADGTPKIGDFGLARLLGDDSACTLSGEVLGTPSYMAPEQAEGRGRDVGPAADLYALGAILYQMLTGRPPFLGASAMETLRLVVSTEVVPPRRQRPDVPRDLETICLKSLEKEPGRRYPHAEALADDLRRFLDGRPIAARPVGATGRLWRWSRRNKLLAATAAALMLTVALGSPALLALWLRARAERARAEVERDRAERSRDRALSAVHSLLQVEDEDLLTEELRPYRKALVEAGLRESQALIRDLEGDPRAEVQRLRAYWIMARLQAEVGDLPAAEATARKAIAEAEGRVARDPSDPRARGLLAWSLHRAATVLPDAAEREAAAARSIAIAGALPPGSNAEEQGDRRNMRAMNLYNAALSDLANRRYPEAIERLLAAVAEVRAAIDGGDRRPEILAMEGRIHLTLCRAYPDDQPERWLAAGERAEAIFQSLVREHPDSYAHAELLYLAREEIAMKLGNTQRKEDAIRAHEKARRTLQEMAAAHGRLISQMAMIHGRIVEVDFNLIELYDQEPAKYAAARRALTAEAHELCDKVGLVMPLSWNLQVALASLCARRAEEQAEDGLRPDLELLLKSERTWEALRQGAPGHPWPRYELVLVRRRLAEELANRGQLAEAAAWSRRSLESARGDAEALYVVAAEYARKAGLTETYPTRLDAEQLRERRRRFVDGAVAMLRQAIAEGFRDGARLRGDPDFARIRSDPGLAAILADLDFPGDPFAAPPMAGRPRS